MTTNGLTLSKGASEARGLSEELSAARQEVKDLHRRLAESESTLKGVLVSRSWAVTRPFRRVAEYLRNRGWKLAGRQAGAELRPAAGHPQSKAGALVKRFLAFVRLPGRRSKKALLWDLEDRLRATEAGGTELASRSATQSELLAEGMRLLEELRAAQATAKTETDRRFDDLTDSLDHWVGELLNRATVQEMALQRVRQTLIVHEEQLGRKAEARDLDEAVEHAERDQRRITDQLTDRIEAATTDVRQTIRALRTELSEELGTKAESLRLGQEVEAAKRDRQRIADELSERIEHAISGSRQTMDRLQEELSERAGGVEAELAKRGAELQRLSVALSQRIDFVRRETLFELRYGKGPTPGDHPDPELRIVRPEKLRDVPDGGHRVNVGCGHIPLAQYINVDRREIPSVDVVAEAGDMPFDQESLAELFSAHLLEHFPQERLRREILPYWKSLLKPGGVLRAVVPDAEAMLRGYRNSRVSYEEFREVTFGAQDYDGDFHFNMFTPDSLSKLLEEAGFIGVTCPVRGRRNGQCLEFEVVATKRDQPSTERAPSGHRLKIGSS